MPIDSFNRRVRQILVSSLGLCAPFGAAIVALPILINNLGVEKFSLFALFWTLIGYTSMFEFGLGKGVNRELSRRPKDKAFAATIISTSFAVALCLSILGILVLIYGMPLLFHNILQADTQYVQDAILAGYLLTLAFPFIILTPILYGVLESRQDFQIVASCRAIIGFFIFALPAVVSFKFPSVPTVVAMVVFVRLFSTITLGALVLRRTSISLSVHKVDVSVGKGLLSYGGWMTITTLTGPILVYADRFLLTNAYGLAATSIYLIPFEIMVRFMVLPSAISSVFFPRFASGSLSGSAGRKLILEGEMILLISFGIPALILIFAVLTQVVGLSNMVGTVEVWDLSGILAGGFLLMSLTYIPQAYLLATGRAAAVAKFSVIELFLWVGYTPYLIGAFGIYGAATGFVLRSVISLIGNILLVRYSR